MGVFHQLSRKHLHRYLAELTFQHNYRHFDTIDQIKIIAQGMKGKQLRYRELIAT